MLFILLRRSIVLYGDDLRFIRGDWVFIKRLCPGSLWMRIPAVAPRIFRPPFAQLRAASCSRRQCGATVAAAKLVSAMGDLQPA
jgi:hypothetical protein